MEVASTNPTMLYSFPIELKDPDALMITIDANPCTKALGDRVVWNDKSDTCKLTIPPPPSQVALTKSVLVSNITKTFDALGWFSPTLITAKVLLQRCWEQKINWDNSVPPDIKDAWYARRTELHLLSEVCIPCKLDEQD